MLDKISPVASRRVPTGRLAVILVLTFLLALAVTAQIKAALGRTASQVVLNPEPGVHLDGAVVHRHREMDRQLAFDLSQHPGQIWFEVEHGSSAVELLLGNFIGGRRLTERRCLSSGSGAGRGDAHIAYHPPNAAELVAI